MAPDADGLRRLECRGCNHLLARYRLEPGSVLEIKCHHCPQVNLIRVAAPVPASAGVGGATGLRPDGRGGFR